jgi:hypothetical protein
MADPLQDLPDLPPLLDQAILDPLLNAEQLIECCDASRERNIRAICGTLARLPALRHRLGGGDGPRLIAAIDFPFGLRPNSIRTLWSIAISNIGSDKSFADDQLNASKLETLLARVIRCNLPHICIYTRPPGPEIIPFGETLVRCGRC